MSAPALNWVAGLAAQFDKRGRQATPGHLYGAAKGVLWAAANRADDEGHFWMGVRRWCEDAGLVDREHFAVVVAWLVELKVLEVTRPAAGPKPARYRFTFRDVDGLPARVPSTPPPSSVEVADADEDGGGLAGFKAARAELNHKPRPAPPSVRVGQSQDEGSSVRVGQSQDEDSPGSSVRVGQSQPLRSGGPALVLGSPGASDWPTRTKPLESQEPPPSGGEVPVGEATERAGSTAHAAGAQAEQDNQPAPRAAAAGGAA